MNSRSVVTRSSRLVLLLKNIAVIFFCMICVLLLQWASRALMTINRPRAEAEVIKITRLLLLWRNKDHTSGNSGNGMDGCQNRKWRFILGRWSSAFWRDNGS